jgi:hypothetical protein
MACKRVGATVWGVVAWWALSGMVAAQTRIPFDPDSYTALAPAGSADTIAPGTNITLQNWQQYKRFMSFGLQVLYSGKYRWHVGSGPDYTLTVGPTRPISLTRQFVQDTEKYGHQTQLVKVDTGGYDVRGYLAAIRNTITSPEEVNYLTTLSLEPDDLSVPQEFWTFLPALRRPFRLSSAARCAPVLGSDFVNDDQNDGLFFLPANFKATFLGEHKVLNLLHGSTDPAVRFNPDSIVIKGSLPGWPKPVLGTWELRDVYVLDITPLPVMGRYCYGHKVIYVDKEGWFASPLEIYDADSKLWKYVFGSATSVVDQKGEGAGELIPASNHFVFLDLQNSHATMAVTGPYRLDKDAPAEIQDPAAAAFPGSLMNIMK